MLFIPTLHQLIAHTVSPINNSEKDVSELGGAPQNSLREQTRPFSSAFPISAYPESVLWVWVHISRITQVKWFFFSFYILILSSIMYNEHISALGDWSIVFCIRTIVHHSTLATHPHWPSGNGTSIQTLTTLHETGPCKSPKMHLSSP